MHVQIDEAGDNVKTRDIHHLARLIVRYRRGNGGDAVARYRDVHDGVHVVAGIDDASAAQNQIVLLRRGHADADKKQKFQTNHEATW